MIALTAGAVVVLPTWVFLLFMLGGLAIITFLFWANDVNAHDLRHERRRRIVHDHLHHDGPAPASLVVEADPLAWTDEMSDRVIEAMHTEERKQGGTR